MCGTLNRPYVYMSRSTFFTCILYRVFLVSKASSLAHPNHMEEKGNGFNRR